MKTDTFSFKPIPGTDDRYLINLDGEVRSVMRKTTNSIGRSYTCKGSDITLFIDRGGYWTANIKINGVRGTHFVHRLIALTFIPNALNKPWVNHKNGNKCDNRVENLEWVTPQENYLHALNTGLCKPRNLNRIPVRNRCTGTFYKSMYAASVAQNIPYSEMKSLLKRKIGTCLEIAA